MREARLWGRSEGVGKRWAGRPLNRQQRRFNWSWNHILAHVVVWTALLAAPSLADTATDVGAGFTAGNPAGQLTAGVLQLQDANTLDTPAANRLSLKDNDDGGTYSCAANGVAGEVTLLDIDGSASDDWVICFGATQAFDIPDTGSDIIGNAQILVGTGAGTGAYVAMSGDVAIDNTGATTIQANSVALGDDTTGGYAASASEAGPATTALALDANPSDCSTDQYATAIAASGNLTCAQVNFSQLAGTATDAQIPNTITIDLAGTATALASNPADCSSNQFATAIAANGNLTCAALTAADMPSGTNATSWTVDADNSGGSEPANGAGVKIEGGTGDVTITYDSTGNDLEFSGAAGGYSFDAGITGNLTGAVTGNASTATALASNPTDCSANQFANAIAASGNLTCAQPAFSDLSGSAADSQIPNNITVDLATAATALAANGGNCSAGQFPLGVDASGVAESCTTVSFTAAGTSGSNQTISNGDTLTIAAGTGITTTGGATDTITVASTLGTAIDTSEITDGTLTYPDVNATQTLAGNPANGDSSVWFGTTGFLFEGATSNTSELLLTAADPSADRTITLPDETGTVCTTGSVCSGYQAGPLSGDIVTSGAAATIQSDAVALGPDTTGNYVGSISCGTGISGCPSSGEGTTGTITASLGTAIDTSEITDGTITYPDVNATETLGGNPTFTGGAVWFGTTGLLFEGATANTSEGLLTAADVSADRTWTLPDETGTICTTGSVCSGYMASGSAVTTLAGDSGTATGSSTLTVAGGTNGINTSASSSTVTINLDTTEIGTTIFGPGSPFTWTLDGGTGTDATIAVGANGSVTQTGSYDLGGASLEIPNGTTAMSTCTVGQIKQDTDAPPGDRLRLCTATDTSVGVDNPFGSEVDASEMPATLAFSGQELDLNTNSGNALRLPVTASNPAANGSIVVDSTAPYELEWYAGSAVRGLSNYVYAPGRASGQTIYGGDSTSATGLTFNANTRTDGNDDGAVSINGGGAGNVNRGAIISVTGNEFFSDLVGGVATIAAGNDPTGVVLLQTGNAVTRVQIQNDGDINLVNPTKVGGAAGDNPVAQLQITQGTIGTEVARIESVATNDDPNQKWFQSRATAAANGTTNIDFSLTGGSVPCPASSVCLVEARTVCRCTSGSSCTAGDGGANISAMTVKNVGGTISLLGAVTTPMASQIGGSSLTSLTLSVSSPNARMAVVVPANFNHTCHVTWIVSNVGT